jgi:hypothetical protein
MVRRTVWNLQWDFALTAAIDPTLQEVPTMARFSIDDMNALIAYNRRRIAQLMANAPGDPLMQNVVRQLEMSIKSVERHRDELKARTHPGG